MSEMKFTHSMWILRYLAKKGNLQNEKNHEHLNKYKFKYINTPKSHTYKSYLPFHIKPIFGKLFSLTPSRFFRKFVYAEYELSNEYSPHSVLCLSHQQSEK